MLFTRFEMVRRIRLFWIDKLIINAFLLGFVIWQGLLWLPAVALVADFLFLVAMYPRLSRGQPTSATLASLGLTALFVVLASSARADLAPVLMALLAPLPIAAVVAVGDGLAGLVAAGIASIATLIVVVLSLTASGSGAFLATLLAWAALVILAVWTQALALFEFVVERRRHRTPIEQELMVASGLNVAVINDAIFVTNSESLAAQLRKVTDQQGVRWLVLDLATSSPVTPREIERITEAAQKIANCKIVLAGVPAEAVFQPGVPTLLLKRLDHYATVTQAVEVGLRQLGWVHPATTQEAREARQPIRTPTSIITEDWWDAE